MKFQGELMECIMCGKQQHSDPNIESQWTCIVADGEPFYICPKHLGNPTWSTAKHERAYLKVMYKIMEIRRERNTH